MPVQPDPAVPEDTEPEGVVGNTNDGDDDMERH